MKGQDHLLPSVKNYLEKHRKVTEAKAKLAPYQIHKLLWLFCVILIERLVYQYISAIEMLSTFAINGCSISSGKVYLSLGSFSKQAIMKSLASSDTLVIFEKRI